MDITFFTGVIGALILVGGAAYPLEHVSHPVKSKKNWLFLIGTLCMFGYSILNYLADGSIFFLILQIFILSASVLMMLNTSDKFDIPFITCVGIAMVIWSLFLFESINTVYFVVGLSIIGIGYVLDMNTVRRNVTLAIGSVLIALFSYLEANWIFFWLNTFFALFSGYYAMKLLKRIG